MLSPSPSLPPARGGRTYEGREDSYQGSQGIGDRSAGFFIMPGQVPGGPDDFFL